MKVALQLLRLALYYSERIISSDNIAYYKFYHMNSFKSLRPLSTLRRLDMSDANIGVVAAKVLATVIANQVYKRLSRVI